MTKLLVMMLLISLTEIYSGIQLISSIHNVAWAQRSTIIAVVDGFINITYEINTILITWIVGFQFNDSAMKLEAIEAHFTESKQKLRQEK